MSERDVFVYSTLTTPMIYVEHEPNPDKSINRIKRKIAIAGGANVANRKTLVTPMGVVTKVSAEDYEWLKDNQIFNFHKKRGHIKVSVRKVDSEVAAADMESRADDAPIVPQDYMAPGYQGAVPDGVSKDEVLAASKKTGEQPAKLSITDRIRRME